MESKKAVVLLSGGLDSSTVLAIVAGEGYRIYALTFEYGQRHAIEAEAAGAVASKHEVEEHLHYPLHLETIGGSALTDEKIEVPRGRSPEAMAAGIPITYVPARNMIFLSVATAWAEVIGANDIFIGVTAIDFSGYPDCRPEFIRSFEETANLGTAAGTERARHIRIHAPLINMSKADIIRKGGSLGVDYALTRSCYDPSLDGLACGCCDACLLRKKGFEEAGLIDPARYVS